MNELYILVSRLGWPSQSVRWWTIHELAAHLGDLSRSSETELVLLDFLRSRMLEAEVVEVLCIFWMAVQEYDYTPKIDLVDYISKPSLLSDLIVESCGLPIPDSHMDLIEVSSDFEIPEEFESVQGVDFPRIFRSSMNELQAQTGLPFLRQMAFEWEGNSKVYPDAPYQGNPWHFSRPLGDGFVSQLSARAALRAISAYHRTLAVAKKYWNMPSDLAIERSTLALPIHPSLAFLKPRRPGWFSTSTDFLGDTECVESALKSLIAQVEKSRPGDELIAFVSPVDLSMERCVEVSMVRWSQSSATEVKDEELAAHIKSYLRPEYVLSSIVIEPFSTTTILEPPALDQLIYKDCQAWPLAATLDPIRMGYLQLDLYPSRLFFPTMPNLDEIKITPYDGSVEVKVEDQIVADFSYWNAGWGPSRPRQFNGNCATTLISRGKSYRMRCDSRGVPLRSFYLWKKRTLQRNGSYDSFKETIDMGAIFV